MLHMASQGIASGKFLASQPMAMWIRPASRRVGRPGIPDPPPGLRKTDLLTCAMSSCMPLTSQPLPAHHPSTVPTSAIPYAC
jgi:hypothetical protein